MLITRATEYAIRALLYLAKHPQGEIVLKKDICRAQDITPAFLTKILQPLIKAGVVGSQRGVGGGFYLLKDPSEVSLLDILEAQEGPLALNQCLEHDKTCERQQTCGVHGAWKEIRDEMSTVLERFDFARLVEAEKRASSNRRD
ncbi:MAG: Rrf2 family transcriptional regulator [Desulfuromonadales bacterium]|nr:Rrf2 family transcriptional regulator [Desulfuromonadales bacterium]NIR34197.1 Rrf2 family transcriptional regulator [Desulfuromonadales bacterium]NIS41645.1 Rrf2 family transcriptional regulator [Desulfuromonadales bacterium]